MTARFIAIITLSQNAYPEKRSSEFCKDKFGIKTTTAMHHVRENSFSVEG